MKKSCAANNLFVKAALCLLFIFGLAVGATAQIAAAGKNEFGIWGGVSPDSSTVFSFGRTADARYGTIGVRYARRFNNSDAVNLKYTVDVIPIAVLNYPDLAAVPVPVFVPVGGGVPVLQIERKRRTVYGFGAAPLGLQANFRPSRKVQPFVNVSGGFLYFNKRVPQSTGTRFALTADVGGGVEFILKNKRSVTVGYKYLHISNANRGIENPGFDNNLFYVGYSFLK